MNAEDYKKSINNMLDELDDSDKRFLLQIRTIIKLHIERKGAKDHGQNNSERI